MSGGQDPLEAIKQLAESFRQVKLGPGVVGKTSYVMLALVVVWGLVIWRLTDNAIQDAALIVAAGVITAIGAWWIRRTHAFAEKNPGLALLEGAQLLEYRRFLVHAKGRQPSEAETLSHDAAAERIIVVDPDEGTD
jgi:hypothetical protein